MIAVEEILKAKYCGDIFPNNKSEAKALYRKLCKEYHPDINNDSDAEKAFAIVSTLYSKAEKYFELGIWDESNVLYITSKHGKKYKYKYSDKINFELGSMYYSKNNIFYVLEKEHEIYYNNFVKRVNNLKYKNEKMKEEINRYFPNISENFLTNDDKFVIVLKKTDDVVPLSMIKEIPKEHLAWITSRLSNICCYLDYAGLSHNGISLNSCFISPEYHTVLLFGGWWYCVNKEEKLIGTEKSIYDVMPLDAKTRKIGSIETDIESVKALGRKLSDSETPKNMKKWYSKGSADSAVKEFMLWQAVLEKDFGRRRFVKWNIDINQFYN